MASAVLRHPRARRWPLGGAAGAAGAVVALAVLFRPEKVSAEAPAASSNKKSIYDHPNSVPTSTSISTSAPPPQESAFLAPTSTSSTSTPTPTDRLASHIRTARLYINERYVMLNEGLNGYLGGYLDAEQSVTSTIASLAPPRESGEQVLPGLVYVSVSAMAASILTRRRIWPVRLLAPLLTATGAAWCFLPNTSQNVGRLVWEYERKVPAVAKAHMVVRKEVEDGMRKVREGAEHGKKTIDVSVKEARETIEDWVKKQ